MYQSIRPILFRLDPERAHNLTLRLIQLAGQLPPVAALLRSRFDVNDLCLEVEAFGLKFKNPIGLAAGYDKNGVAVKGLSALGFGHIEIGTVTQRAQAGNPKPRVHRLTDTQGLINSMGFPNVGAAALNVTHGFAKVGINIGKSKDTPNEQAANDYCALLEQVHRQADYVTINISSPNTRNLRQLQTRGMIEHLLTEVTTARNGLSPRVPVLVKIAPDLTANEIDDVLAAIELTGIDGIIATNTTLSRDGVSDRHRDLKGGLSGALLRSRSTEVIRYIARRTQGRLPIVGVGGIASAQDAIEKLEAGATLIQVYTGLIYSGPGLVRQINQALTSRAFHSKPLRLITSR